jgi:hypothetical protein
MIVQTGDVPDTLHDVMQNAARYLHTLTPKIGVAVLLMADPANPRETVSLILRFQSNIDPRGVAVCLRDLADDVETKA